MQRKDIIYNHTPRTHSYKWRAELEENCYDNFDLKRCQIISESDNEVKFTAHMALKETGEVTQFTETAVMKPAGKSIRGGALMYFSGVIEGKEDEPVLDSVVLRDAKAERGVVGAGGNPFLTSEAAQVKEAALKSITDLLGKE